MLRGSKVRQNGVRPIKFARVVECSSLCETKANTDSMVQSKERLEISYYYALN